MVTPPGKDGKVNPVTLTAAHLAGATEVYKVGGAQAVAALAFGTQSIPRVNKIVGPGNIFVALAKKAVYGLSLIHISPGPGGHAPGAGRVRYRQDTGGDCGYGPGED